MDAQGTSTAKETSRPLTQEERQHLLDDHLQITIEEDTLKIVFKACPCEAPAPCHLPMNTMMFNCRKPPCA